MIAGGIIVAIGVVAFLTWFLAPLGDPETGAGRQREEHTQ